MLPPPAKKRGKKKVLQQLSMTVQACNLSTPEDDPGGLLVRGPSGLCSEILTQGKKKKD
jgi:hypothetical protein